MEDIKECHIDGGAYIVLYSDKVPKGEETSPRFVMLSDHRENSIEATCIFSVSPIVIKQFTPVLATAWKQDSDIQEELGIAYNDCEVVRTFLKCLHLDMKELRERIDQLDLKHVFRLCVLTQFAGAQPFFDAVAVIWGRRLDDFALNSGEEMLQMAFVYYCLKYEDEFNSLTKRLQESLERVPFILEMEVLCARLQRDRSAFLHSLILSVQASQKSLLYGKGKYGCKSDCHIFHIGRLQVLLEELKSLGLDLAQIRDTVIPPWQCKCPDREGECKANTEMMEAPRKIVTEWSNKFKGLQLKDFTDGLRGAYIKEE